MSKSEIIGIETLKIIHMNNNMNKRISSTDQQEADEDY